MGEDVEDTFIKNGLMFIYARQNKPMAEKIVNIENILNDGAYINFRDANNRDNTILHIATQKDEKEVVEFLLKKGALLLYNLDDKTPIHLAKENNTVISKEILNILSEYEKHLPCVAEESSKKHQMESHQSSSEPQNNCADNQVKILYPKRAGTSGVSGQFYETKLLSLVLHRALHDKVIEECYLAANIRDIGDFDDVCFRFKMQEDGKIKHVMCFTQAKHREDPDKAKLTVASVRSTSGQFSMVKYFDSFLKIKQKFLTKSKTYDPMFEGDFNDINCYFILYTPLKESFDRKLSKNKPICHKLHEFIDTREKEDLNQVVLPHSSAGHKPLPSSAKEDIFQFDYEVSDINFLTKFMQQERIKLLGKVFLTFILSNKTKEIMTNDLIQIYHPALARAVIELKVKNPNSFHGKFRNEFFDSDDDLLLTLKETLYKEIVFKRTKKTELTKEDIKEKVKDIVNCPCARTISMLIGEVIFFDEKNNKLCLDVDKIQRKKYKQEDIREINHNLQKVQVTQAIVNDAVNITGKEKLKLLTFELPYTFGNLDFPSNLKDEQVPKERLEFLAKKFYELIIETKLHKEEERLKNNDESIVYPIEINISSHNVGPQKILELSHLNYKGIGGTVGNLLQFDTESQSFSFNTNEETLRKNSKYMLGEIQKLTQDDLTNYKITVKMNNFPRTSFDANKNDRELAEEFLSKLWFYTNQAQEETVERILKKEIDNHYNANKSENQFLFRVHSDAIFLRFHDEILKWWKSQSQARYLTKTDTIFDEAKKDIIDSPVLTVLNVMFIRTIKKLDVEFDADVISSMDLEKTIENKKILNICSDAVTLSAIKIMQFVKYQTNYTFVNLDYLHILPENDYSKLIKELREIKAVTLVIICETSLDERLQDTLNEIIQMYNGKIIVITDKPLQEKNYQNQEYVIYNDENVNLNDLRPKSQAKILKEYKICYQGKEVPLNTIIDDNSKSLIHAKILWSILNKNKIEIGQALDSHKYNEIKDYYINRSLLRDDEEYEVNTLNDIDDSIVLITSKPCMGKTILLTHLSLETKKIDPQPWIVRINFSTHYSDFEDWPDKNIHVTNVLRFLCKAALKKTDTVKNLKFTKVTDETVEVTSDNIEDVSFELEWFIHFYNQGKVIFLFDGFDRIYPHHTKEGIELLISLKEANKRMWITSNCYTINILEHKLGVSYKLDRLSTIQQESFLQRFWKTNLKLDKLNHQQFNNVSLFFNFIAKTFNGKSEAFTEEERPMITLLSVPLHIIYLTAVNYFKNEINSLSPRFLREKLKKKWRLNSYTAMDRFLRRPDEEESELAGTPLHMYIAANYFKVLIEDRFELKINKDVFVNKSNVYLNAMTSYSIFLQSNIKHVCEIEDRDIEEEQNKARDNFLESHKKLALYAICKENDIPKLLTESEIREVKNTIKKIETGEIKSHLIDCVVDGIPRFYNLIFAEYFIVEFATDLLKRVCRGETDNLTLESLWNFIVNGLIMLCPPGVRNAFNYKLKYDPELAEVASDEKNDKILFELILKQNQKAEITGDTENSLNIAINEGLVNITNLLLKSARRYVTRDNVDGFVSILKTGAFVLGAANPTWKELTDNVMHCIHNVDGENLIEIVNSPELEGVSRTLTSLCASTEFGNKLQEKIKKGVCEPIKQLADDIVESSSNNENLTALLELIPYHLPGIVNSLFGKK